MPTSNPYRGDLTVVGGGVVGLTCALAALDVGWRVTIVDDPFGAEAGWVAGGMLGSLGEGHPGEEELFGITSDSVRRWPTLIDRLDDPLIVAAADSLFVASTAADAAHLRQLAEFVWATQARTQGGSDLRPVAAREIRSLENALSSRLIGGYLASGEAALDNRNLLRSLRATVLRDGAIITERHVDDLAELEGDRVLVAAGLGSSALVDGLDLYATKGEILRLAANSWSVPPPRHVVRARLDGRSVYLVPRKDGIVVGATQYEPAEAADRHPRAGGVADLLADAVAVMPGLSTYDLVEVAAGFRPTRADGVPVVRAVDERIVVATGHGRNGILLAPWTAHRVVEILDQGVAHHESHDLNTQHDPEKQGVAP